MQEISRDRDIFEFKIDHLEDLWVLSQFISQDDILYSTTKRKVSIGKDKTKQVTKIMYVELKVQKVTYDTDILRVQGEILNENEFTAIGQSHTLSFKVHETLKIHKLTLHNFELNQIEKSLNSKHSLHLGVLLDKDGMIAFEFSEYGFKVLLNENNLGSKKGYATISVNENDQKYQILKPFLEKSYSSIILSGPSKFKDSLKQYLEGKSISTLTIDFPEVDTHSITKVIAKIFKSNLLQDSQIAREEHIISELLKRISQNSKVAYGKNDVYEKVNEGNIETLLISTKYIEQVKEDTTFLELQEYFTTIEQLQGIIQIIHSKHDSGHVLDGLGGIAGLLRY